MTAYTHTILPQQHGRRLPLWAIAAMIVVALHVAIVLIIVLTRKPDTQAGVDANTVMIDLAPVATSAAPPQEQAEPQQPQQELVQPEPTPTPEQTPPPPPEAQAQAAPEATPVTPPPQLTPPPVPSELQTQDLPMVPNAEAILPPPPKPAEDQKLIEQQKLEQQKKVERQKEIAEHKKEVERERKERAAKAEKARQAAKQRAASQASRASRESGPRPGASGMSLSAWQSIVQARVNGAAASMRGGGESGTVSIAFTVNASGGVGGASVAGSSGNPSLDRQAVSIAHRLGHLPPPPNGAITVRVPVHFR